MKTLLFLITFLMACNDDPQATNKSGVQCDDKNIGATRVRSLKISAAAIGNSAKSYTNVLEVCVDTNEGQKWAQVTISAPVQELVWHSK